MFLPYMGMSAHRQAPSTVKSTHIRACGASGCARGRIGGPPWAYGELAEDPAHCNNLAAEAAAKAEALPFEGCEVEGKARAGGGGGKK